MPSITLKLRLIVLSALFCVMFVIPAVARASDSSISIMMDDDLLLYRSDAVRDNTLRQMKTYGADAVRVTVLWSVVAENANSGSHKARFKRLGADNPAAYPRANWDRYDRLDRACQTLAIKCYFNVTGPGPSWTHPKPPKKYAADAKEWKPSSHQFYKFVQAVGKRYSGVYSDENDGHVKLPRVSFWSLWNEPNQGGWLRPQFINNKPVSPSLYRSLYMFGHRALVSTGHGNDIILVGETSPLAGTSTGDRSAMGPKQFINEMLCGAGSTGLGCGDFTKNGPIQAFAWAHHPYTKDRGPNVRDGNPDSITMANIDDLGTLLDGLAATTGHIRAGMPLMSTEFGWETNPPDPFAKVSLDQQAQFIGESTLQTFLDPRLLAQTQFLLRDVKPNKAKAKGSKSYWGTYQSGLETAGGGPKPALLSYMFPFLSTTIGHDPTTGGPIVNVFGQLRFLPNGVPSLTTIQFQWAPPGTNTWTTFASFPTSNAVGYFSIPNLTLPAGAGQIRAAWAGPQNPAGIASRPQIAQ